MSRLSYRTHKGIINWMLYETFQLPTESASSSSSYSSMSVLMLSSGTSLSSSSQPTKNLGAPRRLSPGLLGSDITVPHGSPQRATTPSYTNTPPELAADGRARSRGRDRGTLPELTVELVDKGARGSAKPDGMTGT